jgi:site-specific recombinase XerD
VPGSGNVSEYSVTGGMLGSRGKLKAPELTTSVPSYVSPPIGANAASLVLTRAIDMRVGKGTVSAKIIAASAVAALKRHKAKQLEQRMRSGSKWADTNHVFATSRGTPLAARNVIRDFQAAIARVGLPRQRFHDLRHAYATLRLEAGEKLAVVSRSLGHANLSTTADIHGHITPAIQERAAARMDAILDRSAS